MKKLIAIILTLMVLLIPSFAHATFDFYQDFDSETVDDPWPNSLCNVDDFYINSSGNYPNCYTKVENDINDRSSPSSGAGNQYVSLYCDWIDCADIEDSTRETMVFAQTSVWGGFGGDACILGDYNDDTEYWIGFSIYIPTGTTLEEGYGTMLLQILGTGTAHTLSINTGADRFGFTDMRFAYYQNGGSHWVNSNVNYDDLKGSWTDIVIQARFYTTDDANALVNIWINGVNRLNKYGADNIPAGPPLFNFPLMYGKGCYASEVFDCDLDCTFQATPLVEWRETHWDEARFTEDNIGTKEYCDVAPPIWPAKPTNITPNGVNITLTPTASWATYDDFRSDLQACFSAYQMKVQVDESGGDWGTLVYDSGTISYAASEQIASGLAWNTNYQIRVAHSSYNTDRSEEYWSEWSDTVYFTTGPTSEPPPAPSAFHIGVYDESSGLTGVYDDQGATVGE